MRISAQSKMSRIFLILLSERGSTNAKSVTRASFSCAIWRNTNSHIKIRSLTCAQSVVKHTVHRRASKPTCWCIAVWGPFNASTVTKATAWNGTSRSTRFFTQARNRSSVTSVEKLSLAGPRYVSTGKSIGQKNQTIRLPKSSVQSAIKNWLILVLWGTTCACTPENGRTFASTATRAFTNVAICWDTCASTRERNPTSVTIANCAFPKFLNCAGIWFLTQVRCICVLCVVRLYGTLTHCGPTNDCIQETGPINANNVGKGTRWQPSYGATWSLT